MNAKKVLLGMVVGGIASGVATLLTTPRSGEALRKNLVRSEEEWRQNLATLSNSIRDLSNEMVSVTKEGKVVLSSLIKDIKISVQAWKESTAYNQNAIKVELDSIQEALRKLENDLQKK
ncbi:YtxH domain-containing protein [Robertmurraya korlensis]|uniref:YtxH domain-containing protein n=1 Tax=Robertmurraya korlensis TaxID=519977 RepID=UPI0020417DA2|nr:YtxH domain-containing protein [Robertmurraya korlensis]MCM3602279.1 YtxH domain-containing protein [Robertmurraya korlensis]